VIERDVPLVSHQQLYSLIQAALKNRSGFDAKSLTPDQIIVPLPVYARPKERMTIDAMEKDPYSPDLRFRVRFVDEPQRPAFYVLAPVQVNTPVLVAAHSLRAGAILRAGDLLSTDAAGQKTAQQLAGFKILLNVPAGATVSRSILVPAPLVLAGHPVAMVYRGSGYTLTSTVTALQSAAMGELVTVRNPKTGATAQARVIGPGQVSPVKGAFHEMQIFQH
jgi:flagella basal body P-ring formation protein FlgA